MPEKTVPYSSPTSRPALVHRGLPELPLDFADLLIPRLPQA